MNLFEEFDMSLHNKFLSELEREIADGGSQAKIAREIGVSASAISSYKSGKTVTEGGDISKIEAKIKSWLDLQNRKTEKLKIPYVEIGVTDVIYRAIDTCQGDHDFTVIIGKAGTSKTETIKRYVEENKLSIYLKINKATVGALMRSLAGVLNIDISGSTISLYERVISFLRGKEWVIIVDEADYLNEKCLQMLRHISDDAGIGIALVGLPRIKGIISGQKEDYSQLHSRVGTLLDLDDGNWKYNINDAVKIIKSVWININQEIVKEFFDKSKGSIRTLVKLIDKAYVIAIKNNRKIPEHSDIDEAKKVVMRACMPTVF